MIQYGIGTDGKWEIARDGEALKGGITTRRDAQLAGMACAEKGEKVCWRHSVAVAPEPEAEPAPEARPTEMKFDIPKPARKRPSRAKKK